MCQTVVVGWWAKGGGGGGAAKHTTSLWLDLAVATYQNYSTPLPTTPPPPAHFTFVQ